MKKRINKITEKMIIIIGVIIITASIVRAGDKLLFKKEDYNKRCPADMIIVSNSGGEFCIDKYENSVGKKCTYTNPANQFETKQNLNNVDCRPESVAESIPWRNISQNQAAEACAKAGKRLPTNKEWSLASLGTPDKDADWGEDDCQVNKNWGNRPGLTGSAKNCLSGAGAYDMIGNVWEWVEGNVVNGVYKGKKLPLEGYVKGIDDGGWPIETLNNPDQNYKNDYFWIKNKGIRSIARGGYWDNGPEAGVSSAYIVIEPSFAGEGIGFRCAK